MDRVVDNNEILSIADVFIGSGGTMTAEAALRGIPTISYNAVPNFVESYLIRKELLRTETNLNKIVPLIRKFLKLNKTKLKKKAVIELKKWKIHISNLQKQFNPLQDNILREFKL